MDFSPTVDPLVLWNRLVASYREACRLEFAGEVEAAQTMLNERVTPTAHAWGLYVPLTTAQKRTVLSGLFLEQRRKVQKMAATLKPTSVAPFPQPVRQIAPTPRRDPREDAAIVSLIDEVQATQRLAS